MGEVIMNLKVLNVNYHYIKRCNMRCQFCTPFCKEDYSNEEIIESFRTLCDKFGYVHLIGGEPFTDLELMMELMKIAEDMHVKLSIVTNGFVLVQLIKQKNHYADIILNQIDSIELCVDSCIEHYNKMIGRVNGANKILTESDIKLITATAKKYDCQVIIKTLITNGNKNEILFDKIEKWQVDKWKVMQASHAGLLNISNDDFEDYIDRNYCKHLIVEKSNNTAIQVLPSGEVFIQNNKMITNINAKPEHILAKLEKNHFNIKENLEQVKKFEIQEDKAEPSLSDIHLNMSSFLSKTKYIREGKAMFFDVEAISRRSDFAAKSGETFFPIPILWTGLVIDKHKPHISESYSSSISKERDYEKIYADFFEVIKKHHIQSLVVSGGDLEKDFIELAIYYLKERLTREDIRYLLRLRDNLFDIQSIISKNIIQINDLKLELNSNKSLTILRDIYPDYIEYQRDSKKDSQKINYLLDALVFGDKWNDVRIQEVINYCFEDVYEDFELYKFYHAIYRYQNAYDRENVESA
jgi:organic radical activating enzyme